MKKLTVSMNHEYDCGDPYELRTENIDVEVRDGCLFIFNDQELVKIFASGVWAEATGVDLDETPSIVPLEI